jgi:hypothetical protein
MKRPCPALISALALAALASAACADGGAPSLSASCGLTLCAVDDDESDFDPATVDIATGPGKADAADEVAAAIVAATADGALSAADVEAAFEAAGASVTVDEIRVIRDALEATSYTVEADARARAEALAIVTNITAADERAALAAGETFAGDMLPEPVRAFLAKARLSGAIAFDVAEKDEDGEGVWTHYPSVSPAIGNMAFDYTEVTPEALAADLADLDVEYRAIIGEETVTSPYGESYKQARYEPRKGGTGHIFAHYDEVHHPDLYARGGQGQKWANNFVILSDGTFHCLPAARRDVNQRLILTNPALARGKRVLWMGHLDVRAGEVVGVELSGRLSKLAGKGKAVFIDALGLLEAWGFRLAPGLDIDWGNTESGVPERRDGVIVAPSEP